MTDTATQERTDLLTTLARHRFFLRQTVRDLSEEQVRQRTTVSALTLASLLQHVTQVERLWTRFMVEGPSAMRDFDEGSADAWADKWQVSDTTTLADLLDAYEQAARETEQTVNDLESLDASQPLPTAPWFEPGATWSARRTLLHILAETAQHAGHADIIRESLDGAKTMG
jgi:uncharacterized damage-inducible protein DinB